MSGNEREHVSDELVALGGELGDLSEETGGVVAGFGC